jgi:hypothetical protein
MGWWVTTGILVAAVALYRWADTIGRQPPDLARPWLVPPPLVMGVAVVAGILMLAHMITLLTGQPFQGNGF